MIPLEHDPGEAQAGWGEAHVYLDSRQTRVQLFCFRSCYSQRPFVMAFLRQSQEAFFGGHVAAFEELGGVPRMITYDNPSLKNRVHALLAKEGLTSPVSDVFGRRGREWLDLPPLAPSKRYRLNSYLEVMDCLTGRIRDADTLVRSYGRAALSSLATRVSMRSAIPSARSASRIIRRARTK